MCHEYTSSKQKGDLYSLQRRGSPLNIRVVVMQMRLEKGNAIVKTLFKAQMNTEY